MLCHLMQNKLLSIDAELEKDQFKSLETRELRTQKNLPHRSFRQEDGIYRVTVFLSVTRS